LRAQHRKAVIASAARQSITVITTHSHYRLPRCARNDGVRGLLSWQASSSCVPRFALSLPAVCAPVKAYRSPLRTSEKITPYREAVIASAARQSITVITTHSHYRLPRCARNDEVRGLLSWQASSSCVPRFALSLPAVCAPVKAYRSPLRTSEKITPYREAVIASAARQSITVITTHSHYRLPRCVRNDEVRGLLSWQASSSCVLRFALSLPAVCVPVNAL